MQKDLFQAISDPTRREIIDLLYDRALPVNEVADQFNISRPAISRHIKILKESGLLKTRKKDADDIADPIFSGSKKWRTG